MASTRKGKSSIYRYKYDYPRNLLEDWNKTYEGRVPCFRIDEFSAEEETLLLGFIESLYSPLADHIRLRYKEKLTYKDIASRCNETVDRAYTYDARAVSLLFSEITKHKESFSSLHWKYDFLYKYDFSEYFPPIQEKYRVISYEGYRHCFVVSSIFYSKECTVSEYEIDICGGHIIWLSEENVIQAMTLFQEHLEWEINTMEKTLPVYKKQLQQTNDFLWENEKIRSILTEENISQK